ncbi:MAG: glutathione S-transferase C-terminal domain-containing protein [Pseudomonadales bacterium]|nr:glutathione S-transferase C-terminal domain-containing protein [Pseudomonadales bacterium]
MLVKGQWHGKWHPVQQKDDAGRFIRQSSTFTQRLEQGAAEASGRFQLYVAFICPWATRTLIARTLLGLDAHIDIKVVDPVLSDFGWKFGQFPGSSAVDTMAVNTMAVEYIHQLYTQSDREYTGRATVPVLWDTENNVIFNNESSLILRIFNEDLRPLHQSKLDLYPEALRSEIDAFNESIYHAFNNGVYRAGFASSQAAYEEAFNDVFTTLEKLENHFAAEPYAVGRQLTESDIRLFVTLVRFDIAYYGLFKTNLKPILAYPRLSEYLERLLQMEAFAKNTRVDHIKAGYYSVKALNPGGIVPVGPDLLWFRYLEAYQ